MSRKDYRMIADILSGYKTQMTTGAFEALVGSFCWHLKRENEKFNSDIFKKACGL